MLGAGAAWLQTARDQKLRFLASIVLAGIIAYALAKVAGKIYYDPRPFVAEHVKPLIPHAADNGFPSDHALFTATLTVATYFFNKKIAVAMTIVTVIVGVARVLAAVHTPLDIVSGWLFGSIGAIIGYYLVTWYWQTRNKVSS
jgi:undecaprenyl-diphosphatase